MTLAEPSPVTVRARPILKWAGGKTQLLPELLPALQPLAPGSTYIEPFFGGGALFYALAPERAVVADLNAELVNLYTAIRDDVDAVIDALGAHVNDEAHFYATRAVDWVELASAEAAARTIFLNRTCFNGLYRVNRRGQFNVPYGRYANPRILDADNLQAASLALAGTQIVHGDYTHVLREHARPGDTVFLDPPYLPVGEFADFKRYTKEQFHEADHRRLADEVHRLYELGCTVVLTNSNHPLVFELFDRYDVRVVATKRHINSSASGRTGEDVIVECRRRAA